MGFQETANKISGSIESAAFSKKKPTATKTEEPKKEEPKVSDKEIKAQIKEQNYRERAINNVVFASRKIQGYTSSQLRDMEAANALGKEYTEKPVKGSMKRAKRVQERTDALIESIKSRFDQEQGYAKRLANVKNPALVHQLKPILGDKTKTGRREHK